MKISGIFSALLAAVIAVSSGTGFTDFLIGSESKAVDESMSLADEVMPAIPEGYSYFGNCFTDKDGNKYFYITEEAGEYGVAEGYWIDESGNKTDKFDRKAESESKRGGVSASATLPSSYDARDYGLVTSTEDQVGGTCWAHAGLAALETNAIKQGLADKSIDLSEYHLVKNSYDGYYPGATDSRNDGNYLSNSVDAITTGGNAYTMENALLNYAGAADENSYRFTATEENELSQQMNALLNINNKYDRSVTLKEVRSIGTSKTNIKKAILEYGGLYIAFRSSANYYSYKGYNGKNITTYYNALSLASGAHAVEVIGWDDNFSTANFGQVLRPLNKGAWLMKNSYGENFGDDGGYFWMSFDENTIYGAYAMIAAPTDVVFMHDGAGVGQEIEVKRAANVFTATEDVYLKQFTLGQAVSGSYTLKIYRMDSKYSKPTNGKQIYKQTGKFDGKKYIDIDGNVEIKKGQKFSVIIQGISSCFVEGKNTSGKKYTSNSGESYYYKGLKWYDSHNEGYNNICIRVGAVSRLKGTSYDVTYSCPGGYSQMIKSKDGKVAFPSKEGYAWTFTLDGQPFDGTGVDRDMTVEAHCYPIDGTVSKSCVCLLEYKCEYCSKEMAQSVYTHSASDYIKDTSNGNTMVKPANCINAALYCYVCSKCGMLDTARTFSYGSKGSHIYEGQSQNKGNGTHIVKCIYCSSWSSPQSCQWTLTGQTAGENCQQTGYDHFTCSGCGAQKDEKNDVTGEHKYSLNKCKRCGQIKPGSSGPGLFNAIKDFFKNLFKENAETFQTAYFRVVIKCYLQ